MPEKERSPTRLALLVGNDMNELVALSEVFRQRNFSVETTQSLPAARELLARRSADVMLLDETVKGESAIDMLTDLDVQETTEVYVMSGARSVSNCSAAMRAGVADYFEKPVDTEQLGKALEALDDQGPPQSEGTTDGADTEPDEPRLIGDSVAMRRVYRLVRKSAPSDASILIAGESGSGKELVARAIHRLSNRRNGDIVAVNCSAVPRELMESELFGHRKGAFTGATKNHRGLFERANGGTLFLDEITEMSPELQAKLLRVLESMRVRPVGAEQDIEVDVRVIAATNQDPQDAVQDERLREDLYYRLCQFPIFVPPLRDRGDDVLDLAGHFLDELNREAGAEKTFDEETLEVFKLHDWPGNVRELKNAVVHGHLLAEQSIKPADLPADIPSSSPAGGQYVRMTIGTSLKEVERRHILATLDHFEGDKKRAAEVLGISLKTMYNRLKQYQESA